MKDQIKELLKSNKNLILTGAPGFGKTYLAKEVAKELTGSDKDVSPNIEFVQFHPSFDYTDFVEGLRPVKKKDQNDIGFELKDGIFRKFCDKARKDTSNKPYVFIIDEINRADISKVFGELFFSIDQGYRGEKGSVKTQYANLRVEGDQLFFVPENVYIIGTMNDIDRSVENFDFAIRRRFAWINLTPELQKNEEDSKPDMRTSMWDNFIWQLENEEKVESPKINTLKEILGDKENKKAYKRIYALNKAISDYDNSTLGKDYQIGPAYFHNLLSYIEDDYPFEKLWQYHLKILLEEYLRGLPNKDDILKSLKEAYDSPKSEE
ncbi:MAG: AAA family ATPase [Bacteroidales bacterium]|nr:AAA family ATPase [Bacteroidales bacterium]MCF8338386.1 AAA family ATPase [Bacteroidales bacterium]